MIKPPAIFPTGGVGDRGSATEEKPSRWSGWINLVTGEKIRMFCDKFLKALFAWVKLMLDALKIASVGDQLDCVVLHPCSVWERWSGSQSGKLFLPRLAGAARCASEAHVQVSPCAD